MRIERIDVNAQNAIPQISEPSSGAVFRNALERARLAASSQGSTTGGTSSQTTAANTALAKFGALLQQRFSSNPAWQKFLSGTYGGNPVFQSQTAGQLGAVRDAFANGTSRPNVQFVPSSELVDQNGVAHDAAYDRSDQTILLSNQLDGAGVNKEIGDELGHFFDQQINGATDTTTVGKPLAVGEAFAERLAGQQTLSPLAQQNDQGTIQTPTGARSVEFDPSSSSSNSPGGFTGYAHPGSTVNNYDLGDNCYYCSVAALTGNSVETLHNLTEQMQYQGNTIGGTLELMQLAGVQNAAVRQFANAQDAMQFIRQIPNGQAVGVAYGRPPTTTNPTGIGHMVVAIRDDGWVGNPGGVSNSNTQGVYTADYQLGAQDQGRQPFPPSDYQNGQDLYVFYQDPTQVNQTNPQDVPDLMDIGSQETAENNVSPTGTVPDWLSQDLANNLANDSTNRMPGAGGVVGAAEDALLWMWNNFFSGPNVNDEL